LQAKHNKNPIGFRWDDEYGWVSLEKDLDSVSISHPGMDFCADAMRFRRGGFKKFLHGQINQMCLA